MAEDAVWTKDEVVTEATRLRDLFRKMFTDRGSFNAVSYLYASRHPETGVYGKGLILVPSHKTATHAVLFVEFPDRSSTRRTRMRSSTSWTITGTSSRFSASARAACHAP